MTLHYGALTTLLQPWLYDDDDVYVCVCVCVVSVMWEVYHHQAPSVTTSPAHLHQWSLEMTGLLVGTSQLPHDAPPCVTHMCDSIAVTTINQNYLLMKECMNGFSGTLAISGTSDEYLNREAIPDHN